MGVGEGSAGFLGGSEVLGWYGAGFEAGEGMGWVVGFGAWRGWLRRGRLLAGVGKMVGLVVVESGDDSGGVLGWAWGRAVGGEDGLR